MPHPSRSHIFDHLGLVAGMFDALGIGEVIDRATQHNPDTRLVTAGHAVHAMVLNGLGCVNQQRYLVPRFFQDKPRSRLVAPWLIDAKHLHDDTLGRALDTLYDGDVTALYRLMAATAAERLGLAAPVAPLESTSFHVDGRYHSDEEPAAQVVHITPGYSRDHRPDLNQVLLEWMIEHQAGMPVLLTPLRGNRREAQAFGRIVTEHSAPWHTTYGTTDRGADRALDRETNLQPLAKTQSTWMTRVPATLHDAQATLAQADLQTMAPRTDGDRSHLWSSTSGGVAPRWGLIDSAPRHPQAQHTVGRPLRTPGEPEVHAFPPLCRSTFAGEADAPQALATLTQGLQATVLHEVAVRSTPRDRQRGRPGQGTLPAQILDTIAGALASSITAPQPRVDRQRCVLLATHALDETLLPVQELFAGDTGQAHVERGFRFLKDPRLMAASLDLKQPERIMALLMVMTVCLLVYAALEYRIRQALQDHGATFPNHTGPPVQHPTARWVFQYVVGMHVLLIPGPWPVVLHLTEEHQQLLKLLGKPYERFSR
jgi:transposase